MLKKEDLLKTLGITEEQAKELNIDVDTALQTIQAIGDGIANKSKETIANLEKQIGTKNEGVNPQNENHSSQTFTLDEVSKLIEEKLNGITQATQEKENEKTVANFKKEAKAKGYSDETIEFIATSTMVDKLENFNFDLFPISNDPNIGGNKEEDNDGGEDNTLKILGLN